MISKETQIVITITFVTVFSTFISYPIHEGGHILTANLLGYHAEATWDSTWIDGTRNDADAFLIGLGGGIFAFLVFLGLFFRSAKPYKYGLILQFTFQGLYAPIDAMSKGLTMTPFWNAGLFLFSFVAMAVGAILMFHFLLKFYKEVRQEHE